MKEQHQSDMVFRSPEESAVLPDNRKVNRHNEMNPSHKIG